MRRRALSHWLLALGALAAASACSRHDDLLQRITENGVLHVATFYGPTTCFVRAGKQGGFECELLARFAHDLGVRLELHYVDTFQDLLPAVERGDVDIAAGAIAMTPSRRQRVRFGPSYGETIPQVVYRHGQPRPHAVSDLEGRIVEVPAGSSQARRLASMSTNHPGLAWQEIEGVRVEALLQRVEDGDIDVTVADAGVIDSSRSRMPSLRPAFSLDRPRPIGWALPAEGSHRLARRITRFFERLERTGELTRLRQQHLRRGGPFDFVDTHTLLAHVEARLPGYRALFQEAGAATGIDWLTLAAMSYQESHWDPGAESFTGVEGLMMLTRDTARQMGVTDRGDPAQSISGGARYLRRVMAKIPERIPEPDRTWLALAAYNVGFGHLEDARILTESAGGDPDRWADVKDHLPLLADPAWHGRTRNGFARGEEPVKFVENIRRYRDTLRLALDRQHGPPATEPLFRSAAGS